MVIPPAKTGNDNNNKKAVTKTAQIYNGIECTPMPGKRTLVAVVIKLIAPNKDDTPAKCKLKIDKSTAAPE